MRDRWDDPTLRRVPMLAMAVVAGSVGWFVLRSMHWPVTGDAALMRYVVFLMEHGRAPYREIGDINLPMSYLPGWLVPRCFGMGAGAWRVYDLGLLAACGCALYAIAQRSGAAAAVWAGCLFALIHGRDGIYEVGQRDLAAATLLIVGVACLFATMRGAHTWLAAVFGVCAGAAAMTKPTLAPFLLLAVVDYRMLRATDARAMRRLVLATAGWMAPVLGCVAWVAVKGALRAFWYAMTVLAPYHLRIGHAPRSFLLRNSLSPVVVIVGAWVVLRVAARLSSSVGEAPPPLARVERRLLLCAAGLGYLSYLLQQRGYSYHRYPFLVFLLIVMAMDFAEAMRGASRLRWLGAGAWLWAALVFAPVSAVKAGHYEWRQQAFREAMEADLMQVAGRVAGGRQEGSLDGQVQCLDSISGCVATLNDMRVVQSTGMLYDEFLFNPSGQRAVDDARASFLGQIERRPPLVFVVTDPLFPAGPDHYAKLAQWPEFAAWLDARYTLEEERRFTVGVQEVGRMVVPVGYRVYVRR
jgi:hypothetical protein